MPAEGQTAVNRKTGERAVYQGGQWVAMGGAPSPQMPANPKFPYEGPKAAADVTNTQLDNQVTSATLPYAAPKAQGDALSSQRQAQTAGLPEGFMWSPNGQGAVPIPGYTRQGLSPEVRQKALAQWSAAQQLDAIVADLETKFREGPGATQGVAGLRDFLPTEANQRFDRAGNAARGQVKSALGLTGGELNTATEAQQSLGAYIPQASDRDGTIIDSIERLRKLSESARQQSVATLGGVPDANGAVKPLAPGGGAQAMALSSGEAYTTDEDKRLAAAVHGVLQRGGSAQEMAQAARSLGYEPTPRDIMQWQGAASARDKGQGVGGVIPRQSGRRNALEQGAGAALNNPLGAAVTGATNMAGFGALEALAPDAYNALGDQGGWTGGAMALGEIGGALAGTGALGKVGGSIASRISPRLLQGGKAADFGRNLATDVAYSGAYGGLTSGDPLGSAAVGGIGSAGGQVVGKGLGRAIGGLTRSADASFLNQRGIPTTLGQDLGGFTKSLEDALTSVPGGGDVLQSTRMNGVKGFNRAAFDVGGELIGEQAQGYGADAIDALDAAKSRAYGNALDPVTIDTNAAPQMVNDLAQARLSARAIPNVQPTNPADYAESALENRIQGNIDPNTGLMTGRNFQEAYRGLARSAKGRATSDYGHEIGQVTRQGQDLLAAELERQNPGAFAAFKAANGTNRRLMTLADAVNAGKNTDGLFTPAQLNTADSNATKRLSGPLASASGDRPFYELAMAGQNVLPSKLPDSGTAKRLITAGLTSGAGVGALAGAGGLGLGDPQTNVLGGFSLAAALALASTKTGQKVLKKALIDRPAPVKNLGTKVGKRAGLFGSATIPLLLEGKQ